jgi:RimJ/RimL family protein N-acetyltransferase
VYCRDSYVNFMARRDLPFIMQLRGSDTIVGSGGLHGCDWTTRKFEAGWWGRTSYLGRGLITEGVEAMLQFAFTMLHAHRVEAFSDDLNSRSCLLCERVGMTLEGVMRHARVDPDGTLRNTRIYAKVA